MAWLGGCAVIPKSTSPDHLRSNLDVVDWELPPGDFDALSRLPYQACTAGDGWAERLWGRGRVALISCRREFCVVCLWLMTL